MSLYKKDVIVALATPKGVGALSVIRISGDSLSSLFSVLSNIKTPKNSPITNHNAVCLNRSLSQYSGACLKYSSEA